MPAQRATLGQERAGARLLQAASEKQRLPRPSGRGQHEPTLTPPLGLLTCTRVFNSIKAGEHKASSAYTAIQVPRGAGGEVVGSGGVQTACTELGWLSLTWVY